MNGTFAVLFLLAGLADMSENYCQDGCLAKQRLPSRIAVSGGDVQFQTDTIGKEIYVRYDMDHAYGPFQPILGASITDSNDGWIGMGHVWTGHFLQDRAYAQLHAMTGLYFRGSGPDLGFPIEFRSGIEFGYELRNGIRVGVSYDHRSNADIKATNPGLETLQLRVSVPLR
ncbi:MAG: acyloxyacyl hydrolase [Thalassovita sp.]|nr:acyloxyacyl hydrolase [Thalassovita sp.]